MLPQHLCLFQPLLPRLSLSKNLGDIKLGLFEGGTPEFPERPKFLIQLRKKAVEGSLFFPPISFGYAKEIGSPAGRDRLVSIEKMKPLDSGLRRNDNYQQIKAILSIHTTNPTPVLALNHPHVNFPPHSPTGAFFLLSQAHSS